MLKVYNCSFDINKEYFSFTFTFDDWSTDKCIVYNWRKNPYKWACDNLYYKTSSSYNQIQDTIFKIIRQERKKVLSIK